MKRRRFDSDDDEDEIVGSAMMTKEALDGFAFSSAHNRDVLLDMGLVSSPSASERAPSEDPPDTTEQNGDTGVAVPADVHAQPPNTSAAPAVRVVTSVCALDRDTPDVLKGLLGDKLLSAYLLPVEYLVGGQPVNDKLLAQYLPFTGGPEVERSLRALATTDLEDRPANRFGIPPGWRWDGVIRGTSSQL